MPHRDGRLPKWQLFSVCALVFLLLSSSYDDKGKPYPYHSQGEMVQLLLQGTHLPSGSNGVFVGSGKCAGCHGLDPASFANITSEGEEVSPAESWRATMMANSAKDPYWRAKVAHEISVNPEHEQDLVNKCTSCHAPMGRFAALMQGQENYSIEAMLNDSLALDGVSCGACHQQRLENLGNHFSGSLTYHTDTIWGPYVSEEMDIPIFEGIMANFVGFVPVGNHIVPQSETCATCHTLLTSTVDLEGEYTGTQFVEQATYHEWLNSVFNPEGPEQKECQGCHMPRLDEPIVLSSGYSFLPGRTPFGQHWLVGGNTFMLELMKNRIEELGITANSGHFDLVIDRTLYQLQHETATIEVVENDVDSDTARYTVKLVNKAGHKFPSGYPARRAYIEFIASDDDGNILFHSGKMNNQYELVGLGEQYEPHYDLIRSEDEVQIYEMVMADVSGQETTVLERADHLLKDNRLVPRGFSTLHAAYDTTRIVGNALLDPNFNHTNGVEGTANDEVRFHVPVTGFDGQLHITARLMFQSVPPRWNRDMFTINDPTINAFEEMYWAEGADPVVVGSDEVTSQIIGNSIPLSRYSSALIAPNPTHDGWVTVRGGSERIRSVTVYTSSGNLISRQTINANSHRIQLPEVPGMYILDIQLDTRRKTEKVLRLK